MRIYCEICSRQLYTEAQRTGNGWVAKISPCRWCLMARRMKLNG